MRRKGTCPFEKSLKTWLDGELPPERTAQVDGHLAACLECRKAAAELREISLALRELGEEAPRPPSLATIRLRLQEVKREEAGVVQFLKRVAAVAAAMLLVSLATLIWGGTAGDDRDRDIAWRDNVMEIVLSDLRIGEDL